MMNITAAISNKFWVLFFAFTCDALIGISLLVLNMPGFELNSKILSLVITINITLAIPLLYYTIISRKLNAPSITSLVIFLLCVGLASLIIPQEHQSYLDQIKKLLVITESALLIYLLLKARAIIKQYNKLTLTTNDFILNIRVAFTTVMGDNLATTVLASEVAMLKYGLFWWQRGREVNQDDQAFSTYKKAGYLAVWITFVFVILIETMLVHFLLWRWNETVAIVATILSAYGLVFFISDLVSLIKRPVVITNEILQLRVGIRWNTTIDLKLIDKIETVRGYEKEKESNVLDCSIMRDPNVRIILNEPVVVHGLYGIRRYTSNIVFNVDDEIDLVSCIAKSK